MSEEIVENSAPEQQPEPGEQPRSQAIILPPPTPEELAAMQAATEAAAAPAPESEPVADVPDALSEDASDTDTGGGGDEPGLAESLDEELAAQMDAATPETERELEPGDEVVPDEPAEQGQSDDAPPQSESEPEPEPEPEPEDEDDAVEEEPPRETKPGTMALLKLEQVDTDDAYRLRPEGEVDTLATSIARLGQLFPVELRFRPPDRFQIISGFRRVAALRLLKRERVLARVHTDLSDEDALRIALADLLEHQGAPREQLVALRERLESEGRLRPTVRDTLDRVLSPSEGPLGPEEVGEGGEEEVDLDELAQDIARRLAAINQDLALVTELWAAMDPSLRRTLLEQLAYPEQLASYLRSL